MVTRREIPNILSWITGRRQISDTSVDALLALLEPSRFPKKHLLVKEGEARGMAYFIEKGMTRSYWLVDGQEITTSFTTEGCVVFSMDELYYGRISEEYVETVEPVEAFGITLADLRRLVTTDLDFAIWWSLIHQDEYRRLHRSHKERLTLPAAERYRAFALQQPEACRRARLTDIASYLGITPSTLSRIRASIFLSQDK